MSGFAGRKPELRLLHQAARTAIGGQAQLVALYGRRQVGKTSLVRRLLHELPRDVAAVYCAASEEASAEVQRRRLVDAASAALPHTRLPVDDWRRLLDRLVSAPDQPLVIALDELPYLERSTPGFASVLQGWWDDVRHQGDRRVLVVLTGSAVTTMNQVLGAGGALYGRADHVLRIGPLDLPTSHELLGRPDPTTTVEAYAACGGFPGFLARWDPDAPTTSNLGRLAFAEYGPLSQAGVRLIADVPTAGNHRRALMAIGRGRTRHGEIADAVGERVDHVLDVLDSAGFVRRLVPVGAKPWSKQSRYELADPYTRFWFGCIYPDLELIDSGQGDAVLRRRLPEWGKHVGWTFEEEARRHAIRLVHAGRLPDDLVIGRYWAQRPVPIEIDVLGLRGNRTALVGEATWSTASVDLRALARLRSRALATPDPVPTPILSVWTRGRPSGDLGELRVFSPADMVLPTTSDG